MGKYVYPAVFKPAENGMYEVYFPDIEGCITCGNDLADAIDMAKDALALILFEYENDKLDIPIPSAIKDITLSDDEFTSLICADTLEYQKKFNNKAVKKTLSIPEWMNESALKAGLNFSQVLQEAIIEKLHLA